METFGYLAEKVGTRLMEVHRNQVLGALLLAAILLVILLLRFWKF
jgi:hypothetical protein